MHKLAGEDNHRSGSHVWQKWRRHTFLLVRAARCQARIDKTETPALRVAKVIVARIQAVNDACHGAHMAVWHAIIAGAVNTRPTKIHHRLLTLQDMLK